MTPRCHRCGEHADVPCLPTCDCTDCRIAAAREAAFREGAEAAARLVDAEGHSDPDCGCSECAALGDLAYAIRALPLPEVKS